MSDERQKVSISVFALKKALDSLPNRHQMEHSFRYGKGQDFIQKRVLMPEINLDAAELPHESISTRIVELTFEWRRDEWILRDTLL